MILFLVGLLLGLVNLWQFLRLLSLIEENS